MSTLNDLKEKIKILETERSQMISEVERMRQLAEKRAASLQVDIDKMREEVTSLRQVLAPIEEAIEMKQPTPIAPTVPLMSPPPARTTTEIEAEVVVEKPALVIEKPESTKPDFDVQTKNLSSEERKVVDLLLVNGGKYSQRRIRTEAGLSWLDTRRVISHLEEMGIVLLEKDGVESSVRLTNGEK
jgi:uncharacterized membrane protein